MWKNMVIMSNQKAVTIHLDDDDYKRLEAEARRKGLEPGVLVESYVHGALGRDQDQVAQRKQRALDALERLARLRDGLPEIDAVQVARESREELERRSAL